MAEPKKKLSRKRRRQRRAANYRAKASAISICSKCKQPKLPHLVCPHCGYYKGKIVIKIK